MSSVFGIVALLTLLLPVITYGGQLCLSCSDVVDPSSCQHVITCRDDEVCFYHKYITEKNLTRYDLGCTYPQFCRKESIVNIFGKRNDHSHIICQECCNNTHVCNADLSCRGHIELPSLSCLSCSSIEDQSFCNHTTTCNKDEYCSSTYTSAFGKRKSEGKHLVCENCCHGLNLCNKDIHCNHVNQKQFNASCVATDECGSNLICLFGICSCPDDTFYWDNSSSVCRMRKTVNMDCVDNFECMGPLLCAGNKCQCNGNNFSNGTDCLLRKAFNQSCIFTSECEITLFCIHNQCKCDSSIDFWTGNICSAKKPLNETCNSTMECMVPLRCNSGKCLCSDNEYWSGYDCSHKKPHNVQCDSTIECMIPLSCNSGKCLCSDNEYWSGYDCNHKKTFYWQCNNTMECIVPMRCNGGKCLCSDNEYWSGYNCSHKRPLNGQCNTTMECMVPLMCKSGACLCSDNEYWSGYNCTKIKECAELTDAADGVYTIWPDGTHPVKAYCIGSGKKWTVIQRRYNGTVDFDRLWIDYKLGFGSAYGEYWLGNDNIHIISTNGPHEIAVNIVTKDGSNLFANYSTFIIADESTKYVLTMTGYSGDAGDGITFRHNGMKFTTKDRDNDLSTGNCATAYSCKGGWWYYNCFDSNPNGVIRDQYFCWASHQHLQHCTMMIRKL